MVDVVGQGRDRPHRRRPRPRRDGARRRSSAILEGRIGKGDVLGVARLAGIMAAKRTADLIPLCHPLMLSKVAVELAPRRPARSRSRRPVSLTGRTGVEMEALTAVTVAALTVYDMCKAIDRGMRIEDVRLVHKAGGKSGDLRGSLMLSVEEARARILGALRRHPGRDGAAAGRLGPRPRPPGPGPARPSRRPMSPPWTATRCAPPTRRWAPACAVIGTAPAGHPFAGAVGAGRGGPHLHRRHRPRRRRRHPAAGGCRGRRRPGHGQRGRPSPAAGSAAAASTSPPARRCCRPAAA